MTGFMRRIRNLTFAFAAVFAVTAGLVDQSLAGAKVIATPVTAAASSSSGVWIIGGLAFSVASIIACAMIVGAEEGREMTLEEALLSGAIPMGCLLREQLAAQ